MGTFLVLVNGLRYCYGLKGRGTALLWLVLSLSYLCYLHGARYATRQPILVWLLCCSPCNLLTCLSCLHGSVVFILLISSINYSIVKVSASPLLLQTVLGPV